ncbi:MAG: NADH-quinone oxidoreductase subunit A [Elusimicrobia bacterium]|nr:NADH-quinone oxidoreductase subunit A [Elusimicrobiota bacterium]
MIAAILINLALCTGISLAMAYASRLLGHKRTMEGDKALPYETGVKPMPPAFGRMTATYHRFAVLFVVFDVDLAFLVPFILLRPQAGPRELAALTLFVTLVALTLAVVWRQGALNCD